MFRKYPKISKLPRSMNEDQRQKLIWFEHAQKFLQCNRVDGAYLEFGCHEANTFRMALNTLGQYGKPNKIGPFYAFDSFAGMPDIRHEADKHPLFRRHGMNCTTVEEFRKWVASDLHRTEIVAGYYEDTLSVSRMPIRAACVYIDCDLYTSTKLVLKFVEKTLQPNCIIAFDDWWLYGGNSDKGEKKAFYEWEWMSHCLQWLPISWGGMSFIYQG